MGPRSTPSPAFSCRTRPAPPRVGREVQRRRHERAKPLPDRPPAGGIARRIVTPASQTTDRAPHARARSRSGAATTLASCPSSAWARRTTGWSTRRALDVGNTGHGLKVTGSPTGPGPTRAKIGPTWRRASAMRTAIHAEAKRRMLRHAFATWRTDRTPTRRARPRRGSTAAPAFRASSGRTGWRTPPRAATAPTTRSWPPTGPGSKSALSLVSAGRRARLQAGYVEGDAAVRRRPPRGPRSIVAVSNRGGTWRGGR